MVLKDYMNPWMIMINDFIIGGRQPHIGGGGPPML